MIKFFNGRVKLLTIFDVKLIQGCAMLLAVIIVKLIPEILEVGYLWFIILLIVFAIRPCYVFFLKKRQPA